MTYNESKQELDKIRHENEMMFRMAISHLMDVGLRHLTDEIVEQTCVEIKMQDDSKSFMTNEFQCEIIRTANKLSKIDHIHLLVYIQREITYDVMESEDER